MPTNIDCEHVPLLRQLLHDFVPATGMKTRGVRQHHLLLAGLAGFEDTNLRAVICCEHVLTILPHRFPHLRLHGKAEHCRVKSAFFIPSEISLDHTSKQIVSDDRERLILVDDADKPIGHLDKSSCHDGAGILHRAFSLFIFNGDGQLLLQKRASGKRLWPGFWSNSCCSHPREGESMDEAVQRRCEQELGFRTPMRFLYKFEYQASFGDLGSEHELCSVFTGVYDGEPVINTTEIEDWQWIDINALHEQLEQQPERFTPWFKLEWQKITQQFKEVIPTG